MGTKNRILLRVVQAALLAQALLPLRVWQECVPRGDGVWTRGNTLLCALVVSICTVNMVLVLWVQLAGENKRSCGFLAGKAMEIAAWLLWLLVKIARSGNAWIFLFLAAAFYLAIWVFADIMLCYVVVLLKKDKKRADGALACAAESCRCDFCGRNSAQAPDSHIFARGEKGRAICEPCVDTLLDEMSRQVGPELVERGGIRGLLDRFRRPASCDFCGNIPENVRIVTGELRVSICADCCQVAKGAMQKYREEAPAELQRQAMDAMNSGNNAQAYEALNQALALNPSLQYAYANRAALLQEEKKFGRALEDYDKAMALGEDARIYSNRAMVYVETLELDKAMDDLNRSLALEPSHYGYKNRAMLYQTLEDDAKAEADYRRALELNPQEWNLLLLAGFCCQLQKKYDQAYADFTAAIALQPENPQGYCVRAFHLALVTLRTGRQSGTMELDNALKDCQRALELQPALNCYESSGYVYYAMGEYAKAVVDFTLSLSRSPESWSVYLHRARCHLELGQGKDAWNDYKAMQQRQPNLGMDRLFKEEIHQMEAKLRALGYVVESKQ